MLAGNVAALLSPVIFVPILTYTFGQQNYNYESMRAIRKVDDTEVTAAAHVDPELVPGETDPIQTDAEKEEEARKLDRAALYSRTLTVFMTIAFMVLWPIPMYGTSYVFSKKFFTGWVVVGLIWLFCTLCGVVIFPLYEGRESIMRTARLMALDLMGRKPMTVYRGRKAEGGASRSGVATPTEKVGDDKAKEALVTAA
jgi:hypothetical protein